MRYFKDVTTEDGEIKSADEWEKWFEEFGNHDEIDGWSCFYDWWKDMIYNGLIKEVK